jgi:hypothetical protein
LLWREIDDNMTELLDPELYPPKPTTAPPLLALPIVLVVGLACLTGGYLTSSVSADRPPHATQLGTGIVTFVDSSDKTGIAAAIAKLKLSEPQRHEVELAVSTGKKQMGWIFFGDSLDPDGDVIAVEAGGTRQEVLLANAWTPVAVPIALGERVGIVAVRDGAGGGVTVAYATRNGQVGFPVMSPGQRIEIDP